MVQEQITDSTENPEIPVDSIPLEKSLKRPLLISILAVIFLLRGLSNAYWLRGDSLTMAVVFVTLIFIFLPVSAAVGMWRCKAWGWWVAAFLPVYVIINSLKVLVFPGTTDISSNFILILSGAGPVVRILECVLIMLYFISNNVSMYFNVTSLKEEHRLAILAAACILIIII